MLRNRRGGIIVNGMQKRRKRRKQPDIPPKRVDEYLDSLFEDDLHAKRVRSLSNATLGVLNAGALGVHAIGHGLAVAQGLADKHAIKQVDRLLSNRGIDVWCLFEQWVPYVLGRREEVVVNMDWTEFDRDDHSMLVLSVQTHHGRSTPLLWTTVTKSALKGRRNDHEDRLLLRLRDVIPDDVHVTVVADRGFGDQKLYEFFEVELGFDFIIRFRGGIQVENAMGERRPAKDWCGAKGRMRVLRDAFVTADRCPVATVVVVQDKGMKDTWCLAVSNTSLTGSQIKACYGRRFSCEEMFRDMKDMRFGLGMSWNRIGNTDRRDRMFLIAALAHGLLTLLGEAGERAGLDRLLKANTRKTRTISLFRQGMRWYRLIPNMPQDRLRVLMESYVQVLGEHQVCRTVLGVL